jgi:hypothetical protein
MMMALKKPEGDMRKGTQTSEHWKRQGNTLSSGVLGIKTVLKIP